MTNVLDILLGGDPERITQTRYETDMMAPGGVKKTSIPLGGQHAAPIASRSQVSPGATSGKPQLPIARADATAVQPMMQAPPIEIIAQLIASLAGSVPAPQQPMSPQVKVANDATFREMWKAGK